MCETISFLQLLSKAVNRRLQLCNNVSKEGRPSTSNMLVTLSQCL